ncbi:MAG: hypothetical protein ACFFE5_16420 [Candidatus Thorarchaeota archaeon]
MTKRDILVLIVSINIIFFNLGLCYKRYKISYLGETDQDNVSSIDTSANEAWNVTFNAKYIDDIHLDSSDNIVILEGDSTSDFWFLRYNNSGTFLGKYTWNSTAGTSNAHAFTIDSQENIIIVGTYEKKYDIHVDLFVVKFFQNGTVMWNLTWSDSIMSCDRGIDVSTDHSDNIYVAVNSYEMVSGTIHNYILLKFNSNGDLSWERRGLNNSNTYCFGMVMDSNESIYMAGTNNTYGIVDRTIFLSKYSTTGKLYGIQSYETEKLLTLFNIAIDSLDQIYFVGFSENEYKGFLLKYDQNEGFEWIITYEKGPLEFNYIFIDNNNIYIGATREIGHNEGTEWVSDDTEIYIVVYNQSGNLVMDGIFDGFGESDKCCGILVDLFDNIYILGIYEQIGFLIRNASLRDVIPFPFPPENHENDFLFLLELYLIISISIIISSFIISLVFKLSKRRG